MHLYVERLEFSVVLPEVLSGSVCVFFYNFFL